MLKIKKYLTIFAFCNLIWFYWIFIFLPIYILFCFYWLYKIIIYYFNNNIKSLAPKKFSIDGGQFKQFIFIKLIIQPYLIAFSTFYITLNRKKKSLFTWIFIFNILKNLLVRTVVGFSLTTIRKADFMAAKFLKIKKIKSKSWVDLLFFNYNVEELNSCNMIERLKIYKDENNKFNFNPNEEKN